MGLRVLQCVPIKNQILDHLFMRSSSGMDGLNWQSLDPLPILFFLNLPIVNWERTKEEESIRGVKLMVVSIKEMNMEVHVRG
jgi:hypothetical protein